MTKLHLFGRVGLTGPDGREIGSIVTRARRLAFLAYLAAAKPRGTHRRDTLLALFWPELDQEHARGALRQTLYVLRDALGPAAVVNHGEEEIGVAVDQLWCDVSAFRDAVQGDRLAKALELYRGDLLDGFFIRGAPEFERWVEGERALLREAAARCAVTLAHEHEGREDLSAALVWARRATRLAPDDEAVVRHLISLLDRMGDRAGAVRVYEEFADRLRGEYQVDPAPETGRLIEAVRERVAVAAPSQARATAPAAPAATVSQPPRPNAASRLWWGAAPVVAIALLVVVAALRGHLPAPMNPNRVVVAPFVNSTSDTTLDLLGELAAEWITRGLSQSGVVEVADIGVERLASSASGLGAARRSTTSAPAEGAGAARALAVATGAGIAVWGTIHRRGDSIEVAVQISDEIHGTLLRSLEPVAGTARDPRRAVVAVRERTIAGLATVLDPKLADWAAHASQPPSYDAYRIFAAGAQAANRLDPSKALPLLYRAAALDSSFTLPLVWAAFVHRYVGQCDQVEAISSRLAPRLESLPQVDQFLLNGEVDLCRGDLAANYRAARQIVDALPGSELMEQFLGRAALYDDRPREAIAIFERLHPDRGMLRDRSYYYRHLTAALHLVGEHERELEAARRARRQSPDLIGPLQLELIALAALGRVEDVNRDLEKISTFPSGLLRTPEEVMTSAALELRAHGHATAAADVFTRAAAWYASQPAADKMQEGLRRDHLLTLYAAGDWDGALRLDRALLTEHPDSVTYQGLWGALAAVRGDTAEASRVDRALSVIKRPGLVGAPTYWRACIAARLGTRDRAVDLLSRAHQEGFIFGPIWLQHKEQLLHADPSFESLHGYLPFETLLVPKG